MKKNYGSPQIEVIEIEVEDAVLSASGGGDTTPSQSGTQTESLSNGITFGTSLSSGY